MSSKIGTVFKFETVRQLKKASFWISLLLLPLAIFAIIGLSALGGYNAGSSLEDGSDFSGKIVGITNDSGMFTDINEDLSAWFSSDDFEEKPTLVNIKTKEEGINKIVAGELNIFYYLPSDLKDTLKVEIYHQAKETSVFTNYGTPFSNLLGNKAVDKLSEEDRIAISGAIQYGMVALDETGEEKNPLGEAIIPFAVLAIFYILICVFGNRLSMSLVEEKENRISEMILTSVSPKKMVIGKILSVIALGFVQIAVFIVPIIATLIIYRDNEIVASILDMIIVNPGLLISNILLLLVSYFFLAGALTFVSSLVPTAKDASNYSGVAVILVIMPLFFINSLMAETPDTVAYILSYFPFSAPIALMIRNAFGSLPVWELIIGIVELAACSAGILSLTVKSFQKNAINFSVVKPNFKPRKSWKR